MTLILLIPITMAYLIIGGISHARIQKALKPGCRYYRSIGCDADCGHSFLAGLSNIFWPIIVPIMIGQIIGKNEKSIADRKKDKQIAEAEHKIELARLQLERIKILEKEAGIR